MLNRYDEIFRGFKILSKIYSKFYSEYSIIDKSPAEFLDSGIWNNLIADWTYEKLVRKGRNHSYDLETLVFIVVFEIFRVYLLNIRFTMITDCNAVRSTANKKDIQSRVVR